MTDELCRDKRQRVATENGKNLTSQLRQRKFILQQSSFQQDVNTRKNLSRERSCRHDTDFFNMETLVETKKELRRKTFVTTR